MTDGGSRHRLRAIMAADAAGYSRLMAIDEAAAMAALDEARLVFAREVQTRQGRVVDTAGDSVLAVFESAAAAVDAAVAIQRLLEANRPNVAADKRLRFRIGVHLGDVVERADATVYGNGVNVAARLQSLAEPGSVSVSDAIRSALAGRDDRRFEDRGRHTVKNIADPVHVFTIRTSGAVAGPADWPPLRNKLKIAGLAALSIATVLWLVSVRPWQAGSGGASGPAPLTMSLAISRIETPPTDAQGNEVAEMLRRDLTSGLTGPGWANHLTVLPEGQQPGAAPSPRARYVVAGALTRDGAGEHYLVRLSVVETESGVQKWSKRVELRPGEPAFQSANVSMRLAEEIAWLVWDTEASRLLASPVEKMSPIELVMRSHAVYDAKPTPPGMDEAMKLVDRALALDPNSVAALLQKGLLTLNRYEEEPNPDHDQVARDLDTLSARALALDFREPSAWINRAWALLFLGRWGPAREAVHKHAELTPYQPGAYVAESEVLLYLGDAAEVLGKLDAERGKTGGGWWALSRCKAHLLLGQAKEAVAACESAIGRNPVVWSAHLFLAAAQADLGNIKAAEASLKAVERMSPGYTLARLRGYRHAAHPEYQRQAEAYFYPGLRRAGMPAS